MTVTIMNYFDNTSADAHLSGPGAGNIESLRFNVGAGDITLNFTQVQALIS